jgi:hypothetical protein
MSDLRGFSEQQPEQSGSSRSKMIAGAAVALMIGAAGVYAYVSDSGQPRQPQKVALSEPAPLANPPTPVAMTPPDSIVTPAPTDIAPPAAVTTPPVRSVSPSTSAAPRARREAHVKTRSVQPQTEPALTPPDTTQVPDSPAPAVAPQAAPAAPEQTLGVTPQSTTPPVVDQDQQGNTTTPQTPQ